MIFLDTETCGFVGPITLIQTATNTGPVELHEVWNTPVVSTLHKIRHLCDEVVCGFNLAFDWFHITKMYNILMEVKKKSNPPNILELIKIHKKKPTYYCLKPKGALDLMLYARKGPWQSLMDRKDIRIRRVPSTLAPKLAYILTKYLELPHIYFARAANVKEAAEWKAEQIEDDPLFSDIVLRFKPSSSLKNLCTEVFKSHQPEFPMPKDMYPSEDQYNPFGTEWQFVIERHIKYWHSNKKARSYAENDIILLQRLFEYFDSPSHSDDDSILSVCVGASRYRGFAVDHDRICEEIITRKGRELTLNVSAPRKVLLALREVATDTEKILINNTEKKTLQILAEFPTALGKLATKVIRARTDNNELKLLYKLLEVGRFHPEFKVIGTLSGRMSGGGVVRVDGSINPQGIPKALRIIFPLADSNSTLSGGDFEGFEVTIADAAYNDDTLRKDLSTGKSFHGLLGEAFYSEPYEQILASRGTDNDLYAKSKTGTFGIFYGQQPKGLAERLGLSKDVAQSAYQTFIERYPGIGIARKFVFDRFCSMHQPGGHGTSVYWKEPAKYIESLLGYRRYFHLENKIIRVIFELAQNPPKELDSYGKIVRRDREQTPRGAMQSALFGCAFQLQARNMRAAANHVIQSTGAELCKKLQRAIWGIQPQGIREWFVQPFNIHDEIMCVHRKEVRIEEVVKNELKKYKEIVPLIKMTWETNLKDWSCK